MQLVGLDLRVDETDGPSTRLVAEGELDVCTSPQLRDQILALISQGRVNLVLDLGGITFIDSCGLGALVGALKRSRQAGGDLSLARVPPRIWKLFGMTNLVNAFTFDDPIELAPTG